MGLQALETVIGDRKKILLPGWWAVFIVSIIPRFHYISLAMTEDVKLIAVILPEILLVS